MRHKEGNIEAALKHFDSMEGETSVDWIYGKLLADTVRDFQLVHNKEIVSSLTDALGKAILVLKKHGPQGREFIDLGIEINKVHDRGIILVNLYKELEL